MEGSDDWPADMVDMFYDLRFGFMSLMSSMYYVPWTDASMYLQYYMYTT